MPAIIEMIMKSTGNRLGNYQNTQLSRHAKCKDNGASLLGFES